MNGHPLDRAATQAAMNRLVRDSLVPIFGGVAGLYFGYVLIDLLLPPLGPGRMAGWSAALCALMGGTAAAIWRHGVHERWAHPLIAMVSAAVLVRLLEDLRALGPGRTITDLDLFLVAIGCVVLSGRWLALISSVAVIGWVGLLLAAFDEIPWQHILFSLPGSLVLSALVHHVRWKTYVRFEEMRHRDEETNARLSEARDAALRNEEELTRQHRLMSGLLNNLPVMAYRIDREGIIRQSMGQALRRFGLKDDELVGSNAFVTTPSCREPVERAFRGETVSYTVSEAGGRYGPWAFQCFATADESPEGGAIGFGVDVTEIKQAEEALRRSETRFRRIFESEAIGIIIGSFDGQITDANQAFLKMTGYTQDDLPLDWTRLTPAEYGHQDAAAIEQMRSAGLAAPFSKEYFRKDGSRIPILLGCGLLDAERREAIGFVLDLTERRRADEQIQSLTDQLEHAGRLGILGEMAVGIAHELNQPLAAIANDASGAMIRLTRGTATPEELIERLKMIASDAMTASAVIRKIKSFITRKEVVRTLCDVHALIDDALHLARIEARRRRVRITVNRHPELSCILADGLQITRVVLNLVLNAVQASSGVRGREPSVVVSTKPRGRRHIEIVVEDNGPGIDESVRERIFQQFVTTREEGLGLGLAMSKSIVDSHAGWLSFVSNPGHGAAFQVVLPVQGEVPMRPPSDEAMPVFSGTEAVG